MALEQKRVVVSHDPDFGELAVARGEATIGIVYIRPGHIVAEFTIGTVRTLLARDPEVTPPFVVVAERSKNRVKIRVRQLA